MVFIPAVQADGGQGGLCVFLGEIHGKLPCLDDFPFPGFGVDQIDRDVEVIANNLLDIIDGDLPGGVLDELVDHLLGKVKGDGLFVQRRLGQQGDQGAFQFADVGIDAVGKIFNNFLRDLDPVAVKFFLQDGDPWFPGRAAAGRRKVPI